MTQAPLRLSSADDLISLVPYLLGFHPAESVVLVWLARKEVVLTARVDIGPVLTADDLTVQLDRMRDRAGADALVVLAYCEDRWLAAEALERVRATAPVAPQEALGVVGGRYWWSPLGCADEGPCAGHPLAAEPTAAQAAAVYGGLGAAPDRRTAVAAADGPSPERSAELAADVAAAIADVAALSVRARRGLLRRLGSPAGRLSARDCARLAVCALEPGADDVALARMTRQDAGDYVALWAQVVAVAPERYALAPLCLLGVAAWVDNQGALLVACLERAEGLNPTDPRVRFLHLLNAEAVPPRAWDAIATPPCRRGDR